MGGILDTSSPQRKSSTINHIPARRKKRLALPSSVITAGLFLLVAMIADVSSQQLKLVDNGYEGLVVAITEDIPQEQCKRVVHGLKVISTQICDVVCRTS